MLRGVNVGSHNRLAMEDLRALYESIGLQQARTLIQSGNVVFRTAKRDLNKVASGIESAIERRFRFHADVAIRTTDEMKKVIAANPFAGRPNIEPGKLLVSFLGAAPGQEAREKIEALVGKYPEEVRLVGRELYVYFPNGAGRSRLPWSSIDKALKTTATARNWNTVEKLLAMAEEMEAAK